MLGFSLVRYGLGPQKPPPNIVIFIADDLSFDDLSTYDNSAPPTPNIDRLAKNGIRFDNVFLTTSSCSPSRASILTGKHPTEHGLKELHGSLSAEESTLGLRFKEAGYYTASAGKWHLGGATRNQFDLIKNSKNQHSGAEQWDDIILGRPTDKPFFFWFAALDPHLPFHQDAPDLPPEIDPATIRIPRMLADRPATRKALSRYYREVRRFDEYVGHTVELLRSQNILDNTIIIVMSDNGRPFALSKLMLYDSGIRAPFIVHWPDHIKKAAVSEALISAIDIVPTLLEAANVTPADDIQGRSFYDQFRSPSSQHRTAIFAEQNWHSTDAHRRAVRTLTHLYIENQHPAVGNCKDAASKSMRGARDLVMAYNDGDLSKWYEQCFANTLTPKELYAIDANGQMIFDNLAGAAENAASETELAKKLAEWRASIGDTDFTPASDPRKNRR